MSTLWLYVWKEWREQRKMIAALVIALFLLTILWSVIDDWDRLSSLSHFKWITGICIVAFIPTVGSDLFARERRKPQLQFLSRVPAGLSTAFFGKLTFFVLALTGAVVLGLLLSTLMVCTTGRTLPVRWTTPENGLASMFAELAVLATWVFAVSTWVRSSVLSVPVTLLMAAGLLFLAALPLKYLNLDYVPDLEFKLPMLGYHCIVAVISARLSFVNAARRKNPTRAGMWSCFGMGIVAFLPVYIPIGSSIASALQQPYIIRGAVIGENSTYAFIDLGQRSLIRFGKSSGPSRFSEVDRTTFDPGPYALRSVLKVDLPSRTSEFVGNKQTTRLERALGRDIIEGSDHQLAGVIDLQSIKPRVVGGTQVIDYQTAYYDLKNGQLTELTRSQVHAALKLGPSDFGIQKFPAKPEIYRSGFGACASLVRDSMNYPTYYRTGDGAKTFATPKVGIGSVRVLPTAFLLRRDDSWVMRDREVGWEVSPPGLVEGDTICALLSDGSLFVKSKKHELIVVDPTLMRRRALKVGRHGGTLHSKRIRFVESQNPDRLPIDASTPFLVLLDSLWSEDQSSPRSWAPVPGYRLASIDFETGIVTSGIKLRSANPIPVQSNSTTITVIEEFTQLVRYEFAEARRTVLFDTEEL